MVIDDAFGNGQTQATRTGAAAVLSALIETFEDVGQIGLGNGGALIADHETAVVAVARQAKFATAAVRCKFVGITEQVFDQAGGKSDVGLGVTRLDRAFEAKIDVLVARFELELLGDVVR